MAIVRQQVKPLSRSPARKKNAGDIVENENFVETITAAKTTDGSEDIVLVDASGGAVTVTLGTPDFEGESVFIKKTDSSANAVTVATEGSETIDGASTQSLASQYDKIKVVSDGTDWFIVNT